MSMREHYNKRFTGQRKDGRIFTGVIIDVWSWPSTNPAKGEMLVIKQDDGLIKSILVNNLTYCNITE
jgi:hypothetical protein